MSGAKTKGLIFVVSGPSGSGKTTLVNRLLKDRDLKGKLRRSVSFTTRPRRLIEKEGRDYFFINKSEFRRNLKAKKILEWTRYLGYYYATPRDFVDKQLSLGKSIILCLDTVGARRIKEFYPRDSRTIFIKPPSLNRLKQRIEGRREKSGERGIGKRLGLARSELLLSKKYDYCLVNDVLAKASARLKDVIKSEINKRMR